MEVIVFETEAFNRLIGRIRSMFKEEIAELYSDKEWLNEEEAKKLLNIKSKTKLWQLREERKIVFSQYGNGRIIQYSKASILAYIADNIPTDYSL